MNLQSEIVAKAQKTEDGYYYLPLRFNAADATPEWLACEALVDSGHARWLPESSAYRPGIVMTGKPFLQAEGGS